MVAEGLLLAAAAEKGAEFFKDHPYADGATAVCWSKKKFKSTPEQAAFMGGWNKQLWHHHS